MWYMDIMEYYSAVKRNEEKLIYIRTWMNLENIIQSEKSDTKGYIVYDSDYMKYPELANP